VIYEKLKVDVDKILCELCERKGSEIIEVKCCPDHIHMSVKILSKYSVLEVISYLKGKSLLITLDRHVNLEYKYGNRYIIVSIILI
jgi:putative transposase